MSETPSRDEEKTPLAVKSTGRSGKRRNERRKKWARPTLEDVSGKVMAQPYIRFT